MNDNDNEDYHNDIDDDYHNKNKKYNKKDKFKKN